MSEMGLGRMLGLVLEQQARRAVGGAFGVTYAIPSEPERLADGTLGYYVRASRTDDCFAAALATCLQVPIEDVPDPRIDERLAAGMTVTEIDRRADVELTVWLAGRGLRMVAHRQLPVRRRRWIGLVPMAGDFQDHCMVMSRSTVLFDPATLQPVDVSTPARRVQTFALSDVKSGLSFRPRSNKPGGARHG